MKIKLAALLLALALPSWAENLKITVYSTNDIHGWLFPRAAWFHKPDPSRQIGGAAVLGKVLRAEKGPKLVFDAGDWFQGTPEGLVTKGEIVIEAFNALGYDGVLIGNHDFDYGDARLAELVKKLEAPALGANIYRKSDKKRVDYATPWIMKEVAGVKVGIFGLLSVKTPQLTFPGLVKHLEFRREVDEAKEMVALLREKGATVVIAVTHLGFEAPHLGQFEGDQTVAREVGGIDLIVGGHTHTFMDRAYREATFGTLITQAGTGMTRAGKSTLEIDPEKKKVVYSTSSFVELWVDQWGEDESVKAKLKPHEEATAKAYDRVVIATAATTLRKSPSDQEFELGNWVTDCMREWGKADVAIQNGGGVRADLPQGPVSPRTIFNISPFENFMVKLEMRGDTLAELLDAGAGSGKAMVQVSGASFEYDREAPRGKRVSEISVGGKPLDPKASYKVVSIDFLVKGGEGYNPFDRATKKEFTEVLSREVLRQCAERQKTVERPDGGRMRPRRS